MSLKVEPVLKKLFIFILCYTVFYCEFWSYFKVYSNWNQGKGFNVLLVADPQIQGLRDEPGFPLGNLYRWDSDRYLSKSYRWAIWAFEPQIVLFLGDLIDEGKN